MDQVQRDAFLKLEKAGYLPMLRKLAMGMCAPFWWSAQRKGKAPRILHNGSICYINTGQREIGVTANHVYRAYLDDKARYADEDVECQFGSSTIRPEERLIDQNARLDIATFDLPEVFVTAGHRSIHTPPQWPTVKLAHGEIVLYGGYPGILREQKPGQAIFPFQSFTWKVTDVTPQGIALYVDFPNLYWPGHDGEQINENPGGISGGPVYRVVEKPVDRLELVGVIYEYFSPWEVIQARHADLISADGQIVAV